MNARDKSWQEGQKVEFIKPYLLDMPTEFARVPALDAGTLGVIAKRHDDRLWIKVEGVVAYVPVWFEGPEVEASASTAVLALA